jgi:3-oxoacyl-[acyl-carrier-protein] synthase II
MSTVVTGWGVLSSAGTGREPLGEVVAGERPAATASADGFDLPLPWAAVHAVPDFDIRKTLGRKGTGSYDRSTGLAVVACAQALADSGLVVDDSRRGRIGITLGTTVGSLRSTSDYSRETLVEDKPYMVNPMLFPNTVMNCATGQAAIRLGLKGVNATVAGGEVAFFSALRYAGNALANGYAGAVLTGAVEELTPHSAWLAAAGRPDAGSPPVGEAAAVFLVESAEQADAAGRAARAEVLAVSTGFAPEPACDALTTALAGCVRRVLRTAGLTPSDVHTLATGGTGVGARDEAELRAVADGLDGRDLGDLRHITVTGLLGDCQAATGALQLAAVLAVHDRDPGLDGTVSLLTGTTNENAVAACLVRGWRQCPR